MVLFAASRFWVEAGRTATLGAAFVYETRHLPTSSTGSAVRSWLQAAARTTGAKTKRQKDQEQGKEPGPRSAFGTKQEQLRSLGEEGRVRDPRTPAFAPAWTTRPRRGSPPSSSPTSERKVAPVVCPESAPRSSSGSFPPSGFLSFRLRPCFSGCCLKARSHHSTFCVLRIMYSSWVSCWLSRGTCFFIACRTVAAAHACLHTILEDFAREF